MVVFGEIFQEKEDTPGAFYRHVDIGTCGLSMDPSQQSLELAMSSIKPRNCPGFLFAMKNVLHKNHFDRKHVGHKGTNAFFLDDTEKEVVFGAWEDEETHGYYTYLTARQGFLVKLDIREDATACLLEPPVRYQLLEWRSSRWDDRGSKAHGHSFPFFQTLPIREEDPRIEELLAQLYWYPGTCPRIITQCVCLADIPPRMRGFFLRRNRAAWWAANRIATVWSRVYWDPTTVVGRRRLARRFVE